MKNNYIRKKVKLLLKNTKGKIDFVSIEEFIKTMGYIVVFFNTPVGDMELKRYSLFEESKNKSAFTYTSASKIIFIDDKLPSEDKNYLLYHEVGHILLGHVNYKRVSTKNTHLMEFEADTFAQMLITLPKQNKVSVFLSFAMIFLLLLSFITGRTVAFKETDIPIDIIPSESNEQIYTNEPTAIEEIVYITRTGRKYHKEYCSYLRNGCSEISLSEAQELYAPCSVCNP